MTILAVIGLSAAAVVRTERDSKIEELNRQVEEKDSSIAELEKRIHELQDSADIQIGFTPCWRGNPGEKRFFVTYDVTFANRRYSVAKHRDFARGMRVVDEAPDGLLGVLDRVPAGELDGAALLEFGGRVSDAVGSYYPAPCRLAVTINEQVTGNVIATINRAGFYPVYR